MKSGASIWDASHNHHPSQHIYTDNINLLSMISISQELTHDLHEGH